MPKLGNYYRIMMFCVINMLSLNMLVVAVYYNLFPLQSHWWPWSLASAARTSGAFWTWIYVSLLQCRTECCPMAPS